LKTKVTDDQQSHLDDFTSADVTLSLLILKLADDT